MINLQLATKLFNIQKQIQTIPKDSKGFNYKYASLDIIADKIKSYLEREKLIWLHTFNGNIITCHIIDSETGEEITSSLEMPTPQPVINNGKTQQTVYQVAGSGITYYRRYTLLAILGLITDEDTDASIAKTATTEIVEYALTLDNDKIKKIIEKKEIQGKSGTYLLDSEQIQKLQEKLNS
jgi:hypothetical protein